MKFKDFTQERKKKYVAEAKQLCEILKDYNPHLGYGSLLGAVRDGKLIESDYDIDICIQVNESNPKEHTKQIFQKITDKGIVIKYWQSTGYAVENPKKIIDPYGQAHIKLGEFTIDLFVTFVKDDRYIACQWGDLGKHKGYGYLSLENEIFLAPSNYNEILTTLYKDYKTPSNDHPSKYLTRKCRL